MSADWYPGIKAFCSHWRHAPMLQQTLDTLEQEFADDNDACIDAAKAIVECACQVIIKNLDDPANPIKDWQDSPIRGTHPSFNNWVSAAVRLLEISDRRDDPFNKVLSQHFNLTDALGNFRNLAGPISHGKEGFAQKLSTHHRRAALLAADAIVTFLHEAYLEHEPDPIVSLEPYERFEASNEVIDGHAGIRGETDEDGIFRIFVRLPKTDPAQKGFEEIELAAEPSRSLFAIDREAYKLVLNACIDASALAQPKTEDEELA